MGEAISSLRGGGQQTGFKTSYVAPCRLMESARVWALGPESLISDLQFEASKPVFTSKRLDPIMEISEKCNLSINGEWKCSSG